MSNPQTRLRLIHDAIEGARREGLTRDQFLDLLKNAWDAQDDLHRRAVGRQNGAGLAEMARAMNLRNNPDEPAD